MNLRLLIRCAITALVISLALVAFGLAHEPPALARNLCHTVAACRVIQVPGYCYEPSPVTGSAVWVAEYLPQADDSAPSLDRSSLKFHADPNLPFALRARDDDYAGSGWDRGHLRAAANACTTIELAATFNLSNAVPQHPHCNRGPGAQLESCVRSFAPCYVVTAPVYRYREHPLKSVGARHVLVPTHIVKAVLQPSHDGQPRMRAFRLTNDARAELVNPTVDEIESDLQRDLFAWLPDELEDELEAGR